EPWGSGRSLITTETRTAATDPASLRRFARYWLLVGPFSALIRRLTLRIVKSDAEQRPGLTSTTRPPDGQPWRPAGGRPGGASGSGSGARVPAQHARSVLHRRPDARDCRSPPHRTPAPNAGFSGGGGHAERRTATRAPSHAPTLARRPGETPLDLPAPGARAAAHGRDNAAAGSRDGPRKPDLGLPADLRRTDRPRVQDRGLDHLGDAQGRRNRPRSATRSRHLKTVPVRPRPDDRP